MGNKIRLVVNPASGHGRAARLLPSAVERLESAGNEVEIRFTSSLEHARELAGSGSDTVVAVGGDGLMSAVASALACTEKTMGVVPAGRGNDFARWLGIRNADAGIKAIVNAEVTTIDLGMVNGKCFTTIASTGLDSKVVRIADDARLIRGPLVYPYATLRALLRWKPAEFRVVIDGEAREFRGYSVAVANSGSFGGGMRIAPDADVRDGLFDVVTIEHLSKLHFLVEASKVFTGGHVKSSAVTVKRGRSVQISSPPETENFEVFADGEAAGSLPADLTVNARALNVFAPA